MTRRVVRRERRAAQPTISLTPLIDVALTLLVIFMVATPMMYRAIKVELPEGRVDERGNKLAQQQEIVVHVDRSGLFYLQGDRIAETKLLTTLKKMANQAQETTVVVKGDGAVSYKTVLELVDKIKDVGGIKYVALATQPPRSHA